MSRAIGFAELLARDAGKAEVKGIRGLHLEEAYSLGEEVRELSS